LDLDRPGIQITAQFKYLYGKLPLEVNFSIFQDGELTNAVVMGDLYEVQLDVDKTVMLQAYTYGWCKAIPGFIYEVGLPR
jgi:hypothetical protein